MAVPEFEVIVVGAGTMGASACWHLAQRGARVLGLEQFEIPNARGSAGGHTRMIRMSYFEHSDYVVLLKRAYVLWERLQQEAKTTLLQATGGLYLGKARSELVAGSLRAAQQHGLAHENLDRAELAKRYPQFTVPDDFVGFFEAKAGLLHSEPSIAAFAAQAMRAGAVLHGHETVEDWQAHDMGVEVRTSRGSYRAQHLIFTAGAWSSLFGLSLGELNVTRQVAGWMWPHRPELFEPERFPVWAIDPSEPGHYQGIHYGFPLLPQVPGVKVALHAPGESTRPDHVKRDPLQGDRDEIIGPTRRYLPDAAGPLLALRTCLYTNSPDGNFIIDRPSPALLEGKPANLRGHAEHAWRAAEELVERCRGRVSMACGFSGHGFKFAPVVGEILADLATTGKTALPVDFLSARRFLPG